MKGSKHAGEQDCDSCGRDFVARRLKASEERIDWICPHCGFDNKQGTERMSYMASCGAKALAEKRAKEEAKV